MYIWQIFIGRAWGGVGKMGQKIWTHLFKSKFISIYIRDKTINNFPFKNCVFETRPKV